MVRGTAAIVTDTAELGLLHNLPLVTWAPGLKPIYVRLDQAVVTGQRIEAPDQPARWWG